MTWRVRFARWVLKPEPEWMVCPTDHYCSFIRMLVEADRVRSLIRQHPDLLAVESLLSPQRRKGERLH